MDVCSAATCHFEIPRFSLSWIRGLLITGGNSQTKYFRKMNFNTLERDLENAIAADEKYQRENSAKFRAVEQKVATYDEFRDIVKASHLTPLDKKEKIVDPTVCQKNVIWNTVAGRAEPEPSYHNDRSKKKHFTES